MSDLTVHCRAVTMFTESGAIDEDAFRWLLNRLVDSDLGVYIGACGPCEGFTFSRDEIRRIYEIGVEVCKGKVFIGGNAAEQHTAENSMEIARIGVDAGVDVVNIYGPAGWHGFRPTGAEYARFFDRILSELKFPVALAPNPAIGYTPDASVIAGICNKYPQVVSINLAGIYEDVYLIELQNHLERDVETYVTFPTVFAAFALGATGLNAYQANLIPKTYRSFLDLYAAGNIAEASQIYRKIRQFEKLMNDPRWGYRWCKVGMKVFKLPGGEGGLREPFLMPGGEELEAFARETIAIDIPEINEMAKAAGLL